MTKVDEVQERNPFKLRNKINTGDGLSGESLMGAREVSDAVDSRTMKLDFDEVDFTNSGKRDGVPVGCSDIANAKDITSGKKTILNVEAIGLKSMGTH